MPLFDIEYWLKTPKEEKMSGRKKKKKQKIRLEAEAEAIAEAEDEANAKLEIEAKKLENVILQEEFKNKKFKKILEESNVAMISAIVENKPIDFQIFMRAMYLTFYFDDKKEKEKEKLK